jgi:hypothetical protein
MKLAWEGSELFLGGTNENLYSGDIEYHKVDPSTQDWQVGGASIKVNGTTVVGMCKARCRGVVLRLGLPSSIAAGREACCGQGDAGEVGSEGEGEERTRSEASCEGGQSDPTRVSDCGT